MSDENWFEYNGVRLPLFHHLYNLTHLNERQVEISIALQFLGNVESGWELDEGLEVGNVLGHYSRRKHRVWDLHERPAWYQENVASIDVLKVPGWGSNPRFPWVISLSTVEHTASPADAVSIIGELAPRGLITFPTGVDPVLDSWLEEGAPGPYSVSTLCREQNDHGGWIQTPLPQVRPYGPWGNCVAVLEWGAES